jgi:hypothetical protein
MAGTRKLELAKNQYDAVHHSPAAIVAWVGIGTYFQGFDVMMKGLIIMC